MKKIKLSFPPPLYTRFSATVNQISSSFQASTIIRWLLWKRDRRGSFNEAGRLLKTEIDVTHPSPLVYDYRRAGFASARVLLQPLINVLERFPHFRGNSTGGIKLQNYFFEHVINLLHGGEEDPPFLSFLFLNFSDSIRESCCFFKKDTNIWTTM